MKVSELIKILKKNGCYLKQHGTRHDIWYSTLTEKSFTVPRHASKEVKTKTANSILKAAGLK